MPELRISLALPSEPRDVTLTKDSLLTNCFVEQDPFGQNKAIKRPGTILESSVTTTSLGIWFYDGKVYYITSAGALASFTPTP
jgi:hypothetical protein